MLSALPDEKFLILKNDFMADQFGSRNYTMPKRLYHIGYTEGLWEQLFTFSHTLPPINLHFFTFVHIDERQNVSRHFGKIAKRKRAEKTDLSALFCGSFLWLL